MKPNLFAGTLTPAGANILDLWKFVGTDMIFEIEEGSDSLFHNVIVGGAAQDVPLKAVIHFIPKTFEGKLIPVEYLG